MAWRAIRRGGATTTTRGSFSGALATEGRGGSEKQGSGWTRDAVERGETDAAHVEALVASKRARWLALERGENDGWARGADVERRAREWYDDDDAERTRGSDGGSVGGSDDGETDDGAARRRAERETSTSDVATDGSLMQLYDGGMRGMPPMPGSLALPRTPASALAREGATPAVSATAAAREARTVRFTLQVSDISFEVGALETIEGTMALYDLQARVKLSENFLFSWPNAKNAKQTAAFTIPAESVSPNIRLIAHLTHLVPDEGGIEDKVYTHKDLRKAKAHADKERQRVLGIEVLRQQAAQTSKPPRSVTSVHSSEGSSQLAANEVENTTLSKRRNTLAWAVLPVFDARAGGAIGASSLLEETSCTEMYRVKENYNEMSLLDAALSSGTNHSLKSHKPIRCKMQCLLSPLKMSSPGVEMTNGAATNGSTNAAGVTFVKELVSFTHNTALDWEMAWGGAVDDGLSRDLYVYVKILDIGKRQDLRVRVQLRDDDLDIDGKGLLAFPSPCGRGLCRESWTTMSRLRAKGGVFHHEARVRLPVRLNPSHHIVLSIYGAQSATTGIFGTNAGQEELLGHSVIKLCDQPETLAANIANAATPSGGDMSLVAVRELLPKYLQSNVRAHMPYWEDRKECVHVRLRLASTMHTGDVHVGALFSACSAWGDTQTPETEDKLRVAVSELSLAKDRALIQHLPAILNLLVSLALRVADPEPEEQEEQLSSRLSRDSRRGADDDDMVSLQSGLSDDLGGSVDLGKYNMDSALPKNDLLDETRDMGTLAFHTLVRIVAQVQRIDPGPKPAVNGVVSHSPPLEAYVTLAFGSLERSSSKHLSKLQLAGTSRGAGTPIHTILARRYSAVLAATRESYIPYEEALSMSWFFLGMIHRAVALERAQSPSNAISVENDELALTQIIDILSSEVKTRGEQNAPQNPDLEKARNLNCGIAMFLSLLFAIPGIKKQPSASNGSTILLGRAGPLASLATRLASMHIKNLSASEGNSVHTALLREFYDTLCSSPVILDIITASAVNNGKNGWSPEDGKFGAGDGLIDAFTDAMRLNLCTTDVSRPKSNLRAACAARIIAAALTRHAWDRSWQSAGARRSIAAAYAPILRLLINNRQTIEELPLVARRDALVSVLMLARDADTAKMWDWLRADASRMKNFVSILSMAAKDFAYERDESDTWSPSGPVSLAQGVMHADLDGRSQAGHLNTCVYKIILRIIREWQECSSPNSKWGVIRVARAMGVMRSKVQNPNKTVRIQGLSTKSSPSSISLDDSTREESDEDVDEFESFNALEGFLGVMLAILSRPQSVSSWQMAAPILNALIREHRKVLMASLHPRKEQDPVEEYPPKPADAPGITPYAFLQGAAIAVFKAAARPPPVRELAVASLRTMLEAAVDVFGTSEQLCPTLIYAMHAAFFPLRPISCQEGLSLSLQTLKSGTEVSPTGWNNSVKGTLGTLDRAEECIRRLADATINPRSTLNVPRAAELEAELALALKSSPAAHVKVLCSLSSRLASAEHWVEAAEASTAAGIIAMQAFSIAAPTQCVWFDHDVQSLRDSFFALTEETSPVPAVAGIRCGTEEINEEAILSHLSRGVELFTRGSHLEAALRVNETAQISWETHRQFGSLSESHAMMAELFKRLEATSGVGDPKRFEWDMRGKPPPEPATFWRVRLLGDLWDDMQDSEWIYRECNDRTLGEMNKKIISQLSSYLPRRAQIKVLSTTSDTSMDEGCAGVQITAVQRRAIPLAQNAIGGGVGGMAFSGCSTFTFDTPVLFTEDGEMRPSQVPISASLRYQGRRRTTITVKGRFPGLLPRLRVLDSKVEEMNPCQSAIQMLEEQTVALLAAANARKPQAELLQRLLQGSLAAGVNGGVPSLINSFFETELPSAIVRSNQVTAAQFLTPTRTISLLPEPQTPESRSTMPRTPISLHKRVLSETAVPMGMGIPLDTPTSASYPSPSTSSLSPNMKAPPPSPASVAMTTPISAVTVSPGTPAPSLSRADSVQLVRSLWKLYRACCKVLDTHRALDQPESLEQLFVTAIQDLRVSIEAVESDIDFQQDDVATPAIST